MGSRIEIDKAEVFDLAISLAILTVAFSILGDRRIPSVDDIVISAFGVGSAFLLHELAHKFTAMHFGYKAIYKANYGGLILMLFTSLAGFIFAIPGGVAIYKDKSNEQPNGNDDALVSSDEIDLKVGMWIALAGPFTNLILTAISLSLIFSGLAIKGIALNAAIYSILINLTLAAFNMIPIDPLDGKKIFNGSKVVWAIFGVPTISLALIAAIFLFKL